MRAVVGPCDLWTGTLNNKGYGTTTVAGKRVMAHRAAYEAVHGAIAPGLKLDHLCRNRACCNPAHLEPVTQSENERRKPGRSRPARTTCGHPPQARTAGGGCRMCGT